MYMEISVSKKRNLGDIPLLDIFHHFEYCLLHFLVWKSNSKAGHSIWARLLGDVHYDKSKKTFVKGGWTLAFQLFPIEVALVYKLQDRKDVSHLIRRK